MEEVVYESESQDVHMEEVAYHKGVDENEELRDDLVLPPFIHRMALEVDKTGDDVEEAVSVPTTQDLSVVTEAVELVESHGLMTVAQAMGVSSSYNNEDLADTDATSHESTVQNSLPCDGLGQNYQGQHDTEEEVRGFEQSPLNMEENKRSSDEAEGNLSRGPNTPGDSEQERFTCSICVKSFKNWNSLRCHIYRHGKTGEPI